MKRLLLFLVLLISSEYSFSQPAQVDTTVKYFSAQYQFIMIGSDETTFDYEKNNAFFYIKDLGSGKIILKDSVRSMLPEIRFEDYNLDKIKDVLIYCAHGARPNTTYYIYLADPTSQAFKKVESFEELPNTTIDKNGIVQSVALYGKLGYSFYIITKDFKLKKVGTTVEVEPDDSDRRIRSEYRRVLKSLRKGNY